MVKNHFLLNNLKLIYICLKQKKILLFRQVMVPFRYQLFLADLLHLVESGKIPMTRIDDAVERILRVKFAAGLFEHPLSNGSFLGTVRCEVRFPNLSRVCKDFAVRYRAILYVDNPSGWKS